MTARPFELEDLGLDVRIVPTLASPEGMGVWISEQPVETQARILIGWLVETEPAPADVMLTALRVGGHLRQTVDPAWITPALEHLLRALRTTTVQEEPDAD